VLEVEMIGNTNKHKHLVGLSVHDLVGWYIVDINQMDTLWG
jgi:hypothetical protein